MTRNVLTDPLLQNLKGKTIKSWEQRWKVKRGYLDDHGQIR